MGDTTLWSKIPPVQITTELPPFELGMFKELFNPQNLQENQDETEEMDMIQNEIESQNKKERTLSELSSDRQHKKRQYNQVNKLSDSEDNEDSPPDTDDESPPVDMRRVMNSTTINATQDNNAALNRLGSIKESILETPSGGNHHLNPTNKNFVPETPDNQANKDSSSNGFYHGQ